VGTPLSRHAYVIVNGQELSSSSSSFCSFLGLNLTFQNYLSLSYTPTHTFSLFLSFLSLLSFYLSLSLVSPLSSSVIPFLSFSYAPSLSSSFSLSRSLFLVFPPLSVSLFSVSLFLFLSFPLARSLFLSVSFSPSPLSYSLSLSLSICLFRNARVEKASKFVPGCECASPKSPD
jgi:hypothetical protein